MGVVVFERSGEPIPPAWARRGHHIVYRANEENRCPGCGRCNWHIGRISAECGFCGTAVPLAEARLDGERVRAAGADKRRHERNETVDRDLQLLIDDSPASFAMRNISAGGAMGKSKARLKPGARVQVRFEGGILIPAVVKWAEKGFLGLAFDSPVLLDTKAQ